MNWLDLVILSLATCQIVETWRHGSIFASLRAEVEARDGFFAQLLDCPFCLSHWVAGGLVLLCWASLRWPALQFIPWAFAVTRLAQLLHDLNRLINTTPSAAGESHD